MQTSIANSMDHAGDTAKMDRHIKKIFSHEAVLAPLMRMCLPEFRNYSDEFIVRNCFLGKPSVSDPVHQDEGGMLDGNQRVTQMNSEDNAADEQVIHYDILFTARIPDSDQEVRVIVNLEIQNDAGLRYQVVTRGLYYCSRMISAQYGTAFTHSEYGKIQKVYSIWICPDSQARRNTVTDYAVEEKVRIGNNGSRKSDYDKLQVVVITLAQDGVNSDDQLIRYLSLFLSNEKSLAERKRQLEKEYRISMNEELDREMNNVCNIGEAILEKGRMEGRAESRTEGLAEGRTEGANLLGMLVTKLLALGRLEDVERCAVDQKYREKLYNEFQIA